VALLLSALGFYGRLSSNVSHAVSLLHLLRAYGRARMVGRFTHFGSAPVVIFSLLRQFRRCPFLALW
jgi:hypothetical protein